MMEKVIDKSLKQENYRTQKVRLKKAIAMEFYFEAIAIEYSILEDRAKSALEHAGLKAIDKNGDAIMLAKKLAKLESCEPFHPKVVRNKMPLELISRIHDWRRERNRLIHALLGQKTTTEDFKQAAEEGYELVKQFDNKVACLNRYFDKQKEIDK